MYTVEYKLKSLSPYIQNNPAAVIEDIKNRTTRTPVGKKEQDALKTGFKNEDGYFIPSKQFRGAMLMAGKKVKLGKGSIFNLLKACLFFDGQENVMARKGRPLKEPDFIYNDPILKPPPKSDMVFNPRVAFSGWETTIKVNILEDSIPEEKIHEVLAYAGLYVGVGSRRPEFGRFQVV